MHDVLCPITVATLPMRRGNQRRQLGVAPSTPARPVLPPPAIALHETRRIAHSNRSEWSPSSLRSGRTAWRRFRKDTQRIYWITSRSHRRVFSARSRRISSSASEGVRGAVAITFVPGRSAYAPTPTVKRPFRAYDGSDSIAVVPDFC